MGKIIVKIKPNGEIAAETKGIKGKKCKDYLEIMSKFLDAKIVDSSYTKEYYEEETEKSIGTGKLTFSSINATVKNINSGYRKKSLPDVNVDWRSEFMNGDLRANWTFNPMNRSEKFNINGSITKLPAKNLDPFVKPYLKVSVDGYFNQIKFNLDGNDKVAGGDFGIDYQDLKVNVLRDDGSKRKLLSAVGNAAVKNDSRGKMKEEKIVVVLLQSY